MDIRYMSPAQKATICFKNTTSGASSNRELDSIKKMIARVQLPDANPNEDDLYGYLQYVTLMANPTGINARAFCTACNHQAADVFSYYYLNHLA
ncbi:hypothetical protein BG011_007466 [Mortierella polycephala]|uniref:Uncharacterized protein n=1 Tax=Mortierella polycephala TaxID=41804 RepID=A0A9P6PQ23_9FUNG|nr:hypothetical protein BG011_007466 [Mortierella polycephala]